jgi:hypothetical protein
MTVVSGTGDSCHGREGETVVLFTMLIGKDQKVCLFTCLKTYGVLHTSTTRHLLFW